MYWLEFAGEDDVLAGAEALVATEGLRLRGAGVGVADTIDLERIRTLGLTRGTGPVIAVVDASVTAAEDALQAAELPETGSVAVRARDVRGTTGIDTQAAERRLGAILADAGHRVDLTAPEHELRVLFAGGEIGRDPAGGGANDPLATGLLQANSDGAICVLGWRHAHGWRQFTDRQPTDRPFFQPGSMAPELARVCVNLSRIEPGAVLVDPMCGTGGVLLEAGLIGAVPLGLDASKRMVYGTQQNTRRYLDTQPTLLRGDARRLPLASDSVGAIVADVPYGRQSPLTGGGREQLTQETLTEAARVSPRAVVVADRSLVPAATTAGWTVEAVLRRRVHRSLTRYLHVLGR